MREKIGAEQSRTRPRMSEDQLRACTTACIDNKISCPKENSDCRYWMNYPAELNCVLKSIHTNDHMTLREVGDRLGISFVRVKQIEDKALKKISHLLKDEAI